MYSNDAAICGIFADAIIFPIKIKYVVTFRFFFSQEAEAFALYHKALDLQKHDKFEESAKAYHELLKTPLLKEVNISYSFESCQGCQKSLI